MDIFNNFFLFSDYPISQKYHTNGTLKFVTSLIISVLSGIITNIFVYFTTNIKNYPESVKSIIDNVKIENQYFNIVEKLLKIINFIFYLLFILESCFLFFMGYYLFIFGVIYSKSVFSCLMDSILSFLEKALMSLIFVLLIAALRKLSLKFKCRKVYNTSKYLNDKF